jgi:tetratricopeptide (TPR) repeat protein
MSGYHFLCYSPADAKEFAEKLYDTLMAGPPPVELWMDVHDERPGDWEPQIVEALGGCKSLIFLMTPDSVDDLSKCKNEWTRALKYKKPIIPLLLQSDAEIPFRLGSREYVDFTGNFDQAVSRLRNHLKWLSSPEGVVHSLKYRLADAKRDRLRTQDSSQIARIDDDISLLNEQIKERTQVAADPAGAEARVSRSIELGMERERPRPAPVAASGPGKFINAPPLIAPPHFQDRHDETVLVGEFLKQDALRMLIVVGRGGIGKTAMVCRMLKSLESGQLPDAGGSLPVNGIIYLSAAGSRRLLVAHVFADLCLLLDESKAKELMTLYSQTQRSTSATIQKLLADFPTGRVVVLMDNFESVIDGETLAIRDSELNDALEALLQAPQHSVKVILTTRVSPRNLESVQPGRQTRIDLEEGLPSPFAENVLRAMDASGRVGLRNATAPVLAEARERTRGFPRALEALFGILSADRDTTLREVLDQLAGLRTEKVVEALVGEAYSRLDPIAEKVMQALAVYGRPVSPNAIDYLLQPHVPALESAKVLSRLVNMYFARKEAGRYYLHPIDRAYALSHIPRGASEDRDASDEPRFTQIALLHRAADYFERTRLPRTEWKSLNDLGPQLAEFQLRFDGEDYESAVCILRDIGNDYLLRWGHFRLVVELHTNLRGKLVDPMDRLLSAGDLAWAHFKMGQTQQAVQFNNEGLELSRAEANPENERRFLGNLGCCILDTDPSKARSLLEEALKKDRESRDEPGEATGLTNIGLCDKDLGYIARSIQNYQAALALALKWQDIHLQEGTTHNLGRSFFILGQTSRAIEHFERAIELNRETQDPYFQSHHLEDLGYCHVRLGSLSAARKCYDKALDLRREIGNRKEEASALFDLSDLAIVELHFTEAVPPALEGLTIFQELGVPAGEGQQAVALAQLCAGDLTAARMAAEAACQYDHAEPRHAYEHLLLGTIALLQNDWATAESSFASAVAQSRLRGDPGRPHRVRSLRTS